MTEKSFEIEVTQVVRVTLDETKFDEAFMAEFRDGFFNFDTLEQHAEHIGRLYALGLIELGWERTDFIEGYGHAHEMGIKAETVSEDVNLVSVGEPA